MNEWNIVNNARRYRNSCKFFELRILLSYPSVFAYMKLDHTRFVRFVNSSIYEKRKQPVVSSIHSTMIKKSMGKIFQPCKGCQLPINIVIDTTIFSPISGTIIYCLSLPSLPLSIFLIWKLCLFILNVTFNDVINLCNHIIMKENVFTFKLASKSVNKE